MEFFKAFKIILGFFVGIILGKFILDLAIKQRTFAQREAVSSIVEYSRDEYEDRTQIPEYVRGKDLYKWILNTTDLTNGISYLGAHNRLRVALDKMRKGQWFLTHHTGMHTA